MNIAVQQSAGLGLRAPDVPRDLREFIELLISSGAVQCVEHEVALETDIQQCGSPSISQGVRPLLFDDIAGHPGQRLALNLLSTWPNCALMLGLPVTTTIQDLVQELCCRVDRHDYKPIWIDNAPCYEHVEANHIDLRQFLPLFRVNPEDAGCYLHKACVVFRDPLFPPSVEGARLGMYSLQVQGPDKLGVHASSTDDLSICLSVSEKTSRPLPVAVCLGGPPLVSLIASAQNIFRTRDYESVSALHQSSFELTHCLGANLSVPAYSEIVLEGYIEPHVRHCEGPFISDRGRKTLAGDHPQITVRTIAYRSDPILDNVCIDTNWTERDCLAGLSAALRLHRHARIILAEVASSGSCAAGTFLRLQFLQTKSAQREFSEIYER